MGIRPSFPLKQDPIYFEPSSYFTCQGKRRNDDYKRETSEFHKFQEQYWEDLITDRKRGVEARNKFREMDDQTLIELLSRFPSFSEAEIDDLRLQFQSFDLNRDGLIDKQELMQVLDDLGDKSPPEKREEYFSEIDEDGSGAIDFEEFIGLIYRLGPGNQEAMGEISRQFKKGSENVKMLRQLNIQEQMNFGLF